MTAEPSTITTGHVYVRPELLYVGPNRVHLSDDHEYPIEPADAGLIELIFRGDSSFARLCERVAQASVDMPAAQVAAKLAPVLRDPRSILELRPSIAIESPQIIFCDFSERGTLGPTRFMIERLRRTHRLLHLGLQRNVHGPWPWNASLDAAKKAGAHESWYDFAQWCRGVIIEHSDALLVLCGHQDTILFGDLASRVRTVVLLDPRWPSLVGATDMLGADWIPNDPFDLVRDLFYALRFASIDDLEALNRTTGSSFARLEAYALRHAAAVAHVMTDQPGALAPLGRDGTSDRLVHAHPVRHLRKLRRDGTRVMLLVAGVERGIEPLAPFLQLARATIDAGRVHQVMIVTHEQWFEVHFEGNVVGVRDIGNRRPDRTICVAAVLFPGLIRDCRAAFEILTKGIPSGVVPSRQPHPLQELIPSECFLRASTTASFIAWLDRVAAPDELFAREWVAAQQRAIREIDFVRFVAELTPPRSRASTELEA